MAIRTGIRIIESITPEAVESRLKEKLSELSRQPEFDWAEDFTSFAVDEDGPAVRVAVANCPLGFDPWAGLRNPAKVGLHPVTTEQLWDFYASSLRSGVDETGRATIFKLPTPYSQATKRYGRFVLISALLPVNPEIFQAYNAHVRSRSMAPWDRYAKAWGELGSLLDKGITRMSYDLMTDSRAVLVMNDKTVGRISDEAIPMTHQGASHGPCKGGHYSQKSVAVLSGLAQFGVSRLVFRDELVGDEVRRLIGVLRSVVLFDPDPPVVDGSDNVLLLDEGWRERVTALADLSDADPELSRYRFCTYHGAPGASACGKCISLCPADALANSAPARNGGFKPEIAAQKHRFYDGALQFDYARCTDERGQLAALYDEWMCGRCVSICGGEGVTNRFAAEHHHDYVAGKI